MNAMTNDAMITVIRNAMRAIHVAREETQRTVNAGAELTLDMVREDENMAGQWIAYENMLSMLGVDDATMIAWSDEYKAG